MAITLVMKSGFHRRAVDSLIPGTLINDKIVHHWLTYLVPPEVNISSDDSVVKFLRGSEIVAKGRFWRIQISLHHFTKGKQLERWLQGKAEGRRLNYLLSSNKDWFIDDNPSDRLLAAGNRD